MYRFWTNMRHLLAVRRTNLPWAILEKKLPVPRNRAASKICYNVISSLWLLWNQHKTDHDLQASLIIPVKLNLNNGFCCCCYCFQACVSHDKKFKTEVSLQLIGAKRSPFLDKCEQNSLLLKEATNSVFEITQFFWTNKFMQSTNAREITGSELSFNWNFCALSLHTPIRTTPLITFSACCNLVG